MAKQQTRLDELITKLRDRGLRLTPQRMAILRLLAEGEGHPTVEWIYGRIRADYPMTSLATVYKTVALLKEMGEVQELSFGNGCSHYDGAAAPHPHVICTACGKIQDLTLAIAWELPEEIARRTGYRIVSHRFDFFGICPVCQDGK